MAMILPPASDQRDAVRLGGLLTDFSEALWRFLPYASSERGTSLDVNTDGWRREGEREAFAKVLPALAKPNLPDNGSVLVSYIPVEESAHRVGRALHGIGSTALTTQVTAEVRAELGRWNRLNLATYREGGSKPWSLPGLMLRLLRLPPLTGCCARTRWAAMR
jgi:hypothetical protein